MDEEAVKASLALRRLVNGYQVTQAIHVAAKLGIADRLADGPRLVDELAAAVGANIEAVRRLLRALASVGVFRETGEDRFALTEMGKCLCSNASAPVNGWAVYVGDTQHWQTWGALEHTVRTGESAFVHIYGTDAWTFRRQNPDLSADFDRAMADVSRQVAAAVLDVFDFSRFATIVDVAGGTGAFLASVLVANPGVRGILFDQPHVVTGAAQVLEGTGIADRCKVIGGNIFEGVPTGGDAYILKAILHDWEDEQAKRILETCRAAMVAGASVLLVERELGAPNELPESKFSDLNMMTGPGGRERTAAEFADLLSATGFRYVGFTPTVAGPGVFVGIAA